MEDITSTTQPTSWTAEQVAEVEAIVIRLAEVQRARKLSDRQLVAEYPDLGSGKTWRSRLLAKNYAGLNPDRIIQRLRRICVILDGGLPDEIFWPELPFAKSVSALVGGLERQTNDRRILAVLAPNGCGKSATARWLVAAQRSRRAYCRIRPSWRNKVGHLSLGLAEALGIELQTTNPAVAEAALITGLRGQPRTLFLDQAHEGGVALMHLLRCLVDETPSAFVYLAYDTAFKRVQSANTDALIEAQAFLGRCLKPVFDTYKGGVLPGDVQFYLRKAADLNKTAAEAVSARIIHTLQRNTNLRLLDDAIAYARASSDDDAARPDLVERAVFHLAGISADEHQEAA